MKQINGNNTLIVDGQPFLILGMQWDCDSCYSAEEMDPLFAHADKLGCNTAALPLYWNEIEPREGEYQFDMLDHRIEMARANNLKVVLIWFGAYKNGCMNYAADYVKDDPSRFRRVRTAEGKHLANFACPTCEETFEADRRAIAAVLKRLREIDGKDNTVILFQVENEPGILLTARCHCEGCEALFAAGQWTARYGRHADEAFSAHCISRFVDEQTLAAKQIYPLPMYVNGWLGSLRKIDDRPGFSYPSGGPVLAMLDIYRESLFHTDFIAPDIYQPALRDFTEICEGYSYPGNALYIAEHSSGKSSRAEKNVMLAIGTHAAIGFDVWAIDRAFPHQFGQPPVHPLDGRWSEETYELRNSYLAIRQAMVPIAKAQHTSAIRAFVQEESEYSELLDYGDIVIEIMYQYQPTASRGIVVRLDERTFIFAGVCFSARLFDAEGKPQPLNNVEKGRFEGEEWVRLHPVRREWEEKSLPFSVHHTGVYRVIL
jgi:hypothetical protein